MTVKILHENHETEKRDSGCVLPLVVDSARVVTLCVCSQLCCRQLSYFRPSTVVSLVFNRDDVFMTHKKYSSSSKDKISCEDSRALLLFYFFYTFLTLQK